MAYWEDSKFKKLQAKWYSKLKKDGFNDVEGGYEDTPYLQGSRGTSDVLDGAKEGIPYVVNALHTAYSNYDVGIQRQAIREDLVIHSLGRIDSDRWLVLVLISQGVSERDTAAIVGRSRGWLRNVSTAYHAACESYARGEGYGDSLPLDDTISMSF